MPSNPVAFGIANQTMACHNMFNGAGMSLTHTNQ
jgi:hypothetical protein